MKKKIFKIKLISIITIISLFVCSVGVSASQPVSIDDFLLEADFPQSLIDTMSEIQKEIIYEKSKNNIIKFAGYETQNFVLTEEDELFSIEPCGGSISESDLTISVFGTYTIDSNSTVLYSTVFPNFVWHKLVKVKNDSFSMAMYSGWEAIPGAENLRLHLMNNEGDSVQYVDLNPTNSHSAGYSYKIPSNTGAMQGLYAGYAYYDIDKMSSSASPRISLHYVHDESTIFDASYSISIGVGSISLSSNDDDLYVMTGNYNVSGLA